MLQSCFYQIAEYIMAPFGLMLFTFYVKNVGSNKSTYKPIIERNGIESLLIACYSCMLYYLSIVAHSTSKIDIIYENSKSGVLLAGFFGLIFLIILKYHEKDWGAEDSRSNSWPNKTALGLMTFILLIIIYKNTHGFATEFDFSKETVSSNLDSILHLLKVPTTIAIVAFMSLIIYFYSINSKNLMNRRIEPNIDQYAEITDEDDLQSYYKASTNDINPPHIKVQAMIKISQSLLSSGVKENLERAIKELIKAKKIAINNSFPSNFEYGIVKMLVKVFKEMERVDLAEKEIDEFVMKNSNSNSTDWIQFGKSWESKLRAILI